MDRIATINLAMQVSSHDREIELTLEAMVDLVNDLREEGVEADARALLTAHGFSRADDASAASVARLERRVATMLPLLTDLPDAVAGDVVTAVNRELASLPIVPAVVDHDGAGLHMHWTPQTASFDDQVIADILMAIGFEVCEHGTARFGVCAATDCEHLFYDATRNGSRRFCSDPRCASRTHTAEHRARRQG
jgi:hypothetical protein